ncbi:MAG: hypothetical protein K8S20_12420 [Chloroflexi bacterium]|nr:hypothetical protein [Chloroflexota bacterium]
MRRDKGLFREIALVFIVSACSGMAQPAINVPTSSPISSTPAISPTLTQTSTPIPAPTETETPQPAYVRVTDPARDFQIQVVGLKEDVQSRNIANWVHTLPQYKYSRIAQDPSHTDFEYSELKSSDITLLEPNVVKDKGGAPYHYAAINQLMVTILKMNPSEFGVEGKNDAYIIVGIMEDQKGRRAVIQYIFGKGGIEWMEKGKYEGLNFSTPGQGMSLADKLWYGQIDDYFILGKPQGPDDLRALTKGKTFYEVQGTTEQEIRELFARIAATDTFSDEDMKFLETHIFFAWPNGRPWSN